MKIIEFHAENFKRIKVVDITPQGNTVVISGRNGAGKSSVLDAIWAAIGGAKAMGDIQKPIRDGASGAVIKLTLDGLVVTRKWTANDKPYLSVESNGMVAKSPQAILDKLVGSLSFDPLKFSLGAAKEQRDTLLGLTVLNIDLVAWQKSRDRAYAERTEVNRRAAEMAGAISAMPVIPDGVPREELTAVGVIAEMAEAQKIKDKNGVERRGLRDLHSAIQSARNYINKTTSDLAEKRASLDEEEAILQEMRQKYFTDLKRNNEWSVAVNLLQDPDMDIFTKRIEDLEKTNFLVKGKQKADRMALEHRALKLESEAFSKNIAELESAKDEAVKRAKFPINGLGFDDNGVTFNGLPFSQCSSAEKLRVSVAMAIAMNPKLRVIRIADGSLLDSTSMDIIKQMAEENDFQIWVEIVDESGKMGVYIEDGEVSNV